MIPGVKSAQSRAGFRSARWQRVFRALTVGLVIYVIIGFMAVPALVKWQLLKQLPAQTHRQATVKKVLANPFALSLTVRGLALTETNGTAFAGFDELYVNFQLSSIFRGAWTFGEIRLTYPTANLIRLENGSFNFSNLIDTNQPSTSPPPSILVQSLVVTNAVVTFTDHTTPQTFRGAYGPVNVMLTDLSTHRTKAEPYTFVATTGDGETFSWAGDFSLNLLRSSGEFKLTGIPPGKYSPYLAQFTSLRLERGTLDLGARYAVNAAANPIELTVTNAMLELRDLLVKPPDEETPLLAVECFRVTHASADLTGQVARVRKVWCDGGSVTIGRETNGQLAVLNYVTLASDSGKSEAPELNSDAPRNAWQFRLDECAVTNFNVTVLDPSPGELAEIGLDQLRLELKGLSNQSNAPMALTLGFDWRAGGAAALEAGGTILPLALTNSVTVNQLELAALQPYVGALLNVVIHSGGLNVQGRAELNPEATPQIRFQGDVGITNFASSDTVAYHELAAWDNLSVQDMDLSLQTNRLDIAKIVFTGARNNVVVSSNGTLNLTALVKAPPEAAAATNPARTSPALFPVHIGAVVFERSSFRAADDSLLRPFETSIEQFNGSVRDIVLPGLNKAHVDIRGRVSALAPFEIVGEITPDPQNLYVDLKLAFTNVDLTVLSPYAEKYVGRPLVRGKLTTEKYYHISHRALAATNLIELDKLTFGRRVESPFATALPVKLAVGLLKDVNGQIELDLPLSGSLDAPDFSVRDILLDTFRNLIVRVASSPFSLLGALAGGGAELQYVDFDPGLAVLNEGQTNKLFKLSEALATRPALELEIGATFDPQADVDRLGRQKVRERMKRLRVEELVARGRPAPALAELQLSEDDYERLLRKAYRTAFNTTPEEALREALTAALATNASGTVSVAENAAGRPAPSHKGATQLVSRGKSLTQLAAALQTPTGSDSASSVEPPTERELVRDEMERRLISVSPVTPDEIRTLLVRRIETVERFLVQKAGIAAERVARTTPNPSEPKSQGEARVVFTLE